MLAFVHKLFVTPEAHRDPYVWGGVFGSHMAFGMIGWTIAVYLTGDAYFSAKLAIFTYFLWEAAQFAIRRKMTIFLDCVLDWIAFTSMVLGVLEIWLNNAGNALGYVLGAVAIMMIGVCKRLKNV